MIRGNQAFEPCQAFPQLSILLNLTTSWQPFTLDGDADNVGRLTGRARIPFIASDLALVTRFAAEFRNLILLPLRRRVPGARLASRHARSRAKAAGNAGRSRYDLWLNREYFYQSLEMLCTRCRNREVRTYKTSPVPVCAKAP